MLRHHVLHPPLRLILVATGLLLGGCHEPLDMQVASYDMLYERLTTCRGYDVPQEQFDRHVAKYPNDFHELRRCSTLGDCAGFEQCFRAVSAALDPQRRAERVGDASAELVETVRTGQWEDAEALCAELHVDPDPPAEVPETCGQLDALAVSGLTALITALRDLPGVGVGHLRRCGELHRYAARVSEDAEARARTLCREAAVSVDVHELLARAAELVETGQPRIPAGCGPSIGALGDLGTRWAGRLLPAVLSACYVRLGEVILDARRSGRCPPTVRRLIRAADTHGEVVTEPLGEALERARGDCR